MGNSEEGVDIPGGSDPMAGHKSPDAFRTISEVSDDLDVPQHVLRFWEGKFTQIKPLKRGGGRRYYRPDDVELLRGIQHLLYSDGFTIKGVQKLLREHGVKFVTNAGRRTSQGRGKAPPPVIGSPAVESAARSEAVMTAPKSVPQRIEPVFTEPHRVSAARPQEPPGADRIARAARMLAKLKALRRDFDEKRKAARNQGQG
jgi:DNA-binding transcriptional MerR regulator